jgi:hypothetical protein
MALSSSAVESGAGTPTKFLLRRPMEDVWFLLKESKVSLRVRK